MVNGNGQKRKRKDLIDKKAAIWILINAFDDCTHFRSADYVRIRRQLESLPSVDIREQLDNAYAHGYTAAESEYRAILDTMPKVVRCEDCNGYQDVHQWCKLHEVEMQPMDFCSYGERKNAAD